MYHWNDDSHVQVECPVCEEIPANPDEGGQCSCGETQWRMGPAQRRHEARPLIDGLDWLEIPEHAPVDHSGLNTNELLHAAF
jgi:hypothetical protein